MKKLYKVEVSYEIFLLADSEDDAMDQEYGFIVSNEEPMVIAVEKVDRNTFICEEWSECGVLPYGTNMDYPLDVRTWAEKQGWSPDR